MLVSQQGDNKEGQTHRWEGQRQKAGHRTEEKEPAGQGDKPGHWGPVHREGSGSHCLPTVPTWHALWR